MISTVRLLSMRISASLPVMFALLVTVGSALSARATEGVPGEIFVTAKINDSDWGIMRIDPVTGNRTIISDNTHGAGVAFTMPVGLSVTPAGALLVTDQGAQGDPQPNPLSIGTTSSPPAPTRVFLVDPATGDRSVLSQDSLTVSPPGTSYPAIGSGPAIGQPTVGRQLGNQILLPAEDDLLSNVRLMAINPQSGNRTLISGAARGAGPFMSFPGGIAASGNTAVVADAFKGVFEINITTGDRTILSGAGQGSGATFKGGWDIAAYGGHLVVTGGTLNSGPMPMEFFKSIR